MPQVWLKFPAFHTGSRMCAGMTRNADRIEQRRERLRQMHDDRVVVGRLGGDALVVDGE